MYIFDFKYLIYIIKFFDINGCVKIKTFTCKIIWFI